MIVVKLKGGLGNQLFQYAMGRVLAKKNGVPFKMDISFFENYEWHEYSLDPFSIQKNIATKKEVEKLNSSNIGFLGKIKKRILGAGKPVVYNENSLAYNADYLNISDPAYLDGYWQCEKYFESEAELIQKEFRVAIPPSKLNADLLQKIKTTEAISLHIRRGNYVNVDVVNKVHGTCSMEYYEQAIKLVAEKSKQPCFYIFSDDIPWAKENLLMPYDHVFVDINDDKTDYEDMRLMYNCRHSILANSTFSWWGAWLNNNPGKIVIAPKKWFNDPALAAEDLVPSRWIRI